MWRRQWHPTPVLLPGKSHGRRSLVGGSPWGRTESDTTERLHFHFSLSCIGEGNGNPLQCSCLENPRDGGASMGSHRVGHDWSNLAAAAVKNDVKHLSVCLFATCIYFLVKTCCSHFLNWDFYFPVVEFWFSLYIFIVNSLTYVWPPNTSSKLSLVFEVKWSLSVVSDSLRPHGL